MALSKEMEEELRVNYSWLSHLLIQFLLAQYEENETHIETLRKYVADDAPSSDSESIQWALEQAKNILKLEPFPAKWVADGTGWGYPEGGGDYPEYEREFIEWLIENLEIEAKKVGKL